MLGRISAVQSRNKANQVTETVTATPSGAIVHDRTIMSEIDDSRFTAGGWAHAEPVRAALRAGGRGNTLYVGNVPRQFVLRRYRRGGLIGKVVRRHYLWTGEERTRPFQEWRLLARLVDLGLRVPRPAAARYERYGPVYTADLITVRIPGAMALSERIADAPRDQRFWASIGVAIREFHAAGVYHADLNAYNVQLDDDGDVWLIDFDRGRLRSAGPWQQHNLNRLHRSLEKVRSMDPGVHYAKENWEQLLEGYFDAARSA